MFLIELDLLSTPIQVHCSSSAIDLIVWGTRYTYSVFPNDY